MKCLRTAFLVLGATLVGGCEKKPREPNVFDLSAAEAFERLATNRLEELVYRRQCGILIHVTPQGVPNEQVIWRVHSSGRKVAEFTAVLTPLGERKTRVEVKIQPGPNGAEAYDGSQSYTRPAFNQPLRPAVEEQVAALLEKRPYDVKRVGPGRDSACNVQRGGLERGVRFRVDDLPGMDAQQSSRCREVRQRGGSC